MPASVPARVSTWFARLGLLALVFIAPWPFGSVTPRPAALLSAAVIVLAGVYVVSSVVRRKLAAPPFWGWLAGGAILVLSQLVPLPAKGIDLIAPAVGELYRALGDVSARPAWHAMSAEPFQTRWKLVQLTSFMVAFYLASQLFRHGRERRIAAYGITILGVAVALFGVYQNARYGTVLYGRYQVPSATPYGPFVNHNHFAGFVEACALLALGTAVGMARRSPSLAVLLGGASGLMAISLLLSHSRGGWIAAAAGVLVIAAGARHEALPGHRWLAAGVVSISLFAIAFAPANVTERLATLGAPGGDRSVQFRLDLWRDSVALVAASPVVGTGLGTYAAVIPGHRTGVDETRAEFAESDWVQLVSETGALGLLLTIGFLVSVARAAVRALVEERSARNRGTILGALAAAAALLVHGVYDFNLHIPSNALLFVVLLGMLAASEDTLTFRWHSHRPAPIVAVATAGLVVAFAILSFDIGESRRLTREIDPVLTSPDDFSDSIARLVRSRRTVPDNPATVHLLGRLYNEEAYRSPDAARYRNVRLDQAAAAFRDAIALGPARARSWFELGWTEANRGNDTVADRSFTRALHLDPVQSRFRANYAAYLASRGRVDDALVQLERGRELQPGIAPLDAVNILAPFVSEDPILLRRAAGGGADGDSALEKYRASRDGDGSR